MPSADALNAGVDIISEDSGVAQSVLTAVQSGKLKMAVLIAPCSAVSREIEAGPHGSPDRSPSPYPRHRRRLQGTLDLALQMAREGTVLLKNDDAPGAPAWASSFRWTCAGINSLAILGRYATSPSLAPTSPAGPSAMASTAYTAGPVVPPGTAIESALGDRIIVRRPSYQDVEGSAKAAADSDLAIVVVGINNDIENEGVDRCTLELPPEQLAFVQRIVKANPATIVVLQGGSPIACAWLKDHVPAIVMMWYAGEQGGPALADILLGRSNPSGRLPITFYNSVSDLPPLDDYEIDARAYLHVPQETAGFRLWPRLELYDVFLRQSAPVARAGAASGRRGGRERRRRGLHVQPGRDQHRPHGRRRNRCQLYVSKPQSVVTRPSGSCAISRVMCPWAQTRTVQLKVPLKGFGLLGRRRATIRRGTGPL